MGISQKVKHIMLLIKEMVKVRNTFLDDENYVENVQVLKLFVHQCFTFSNMCLEHWVKCYGELTL